MSLYERLIRRDKPVSVNEVDWDKVYANLLPRIYNFFLYRLGDGPQAEDLTADTFEKAWRYRKRYRTELASFETWIFSIARNLAVSHYRKMRPQVSLSDVEDATDGLNVEAHVHDQQDIARLRRLLMDLPERDQELIALKYGADLNNREIAGMTGLSESNVGTILHRMVLRLRKQWEVYA
jgi:RNA polymerase sigma-70 factor, ECF subfamily